MPVALIIFLCGGLLMMLRFPYLLSKSLFFKLSKSEKDQAKVIKELLENLGAEVPSEIPLVAKEKERNLFEALNRDLEMDHQDYFHYYERIYEAEEKGITAILPVLNKLREDEEEHRQTLLYILQRLNPYQV